MSSLPIPAASVEGLGLGGGGEGDVGGGEGDGGGELGEDGGLGGGGLGDGDGGLGDSAGGDGDKFPSCASAEGGSGSELCRGWRGARRKGAARSKILSWSSGSCCAVRLKRRSSCACMDRARLASFSAG